MIRCGSPVKTGPGAAVYTPMSRLHSLRLTMTGVVVLLDERRVIFALVRLQNSAPARIDLAVPVAHTPSTRDAELLPAGVTEGEA